MRSGRVDEKLEGEMNVAQNAIEGLQLCPVPRIQDDDGLA